MDLDPLEINCGYSK